MYLGTEFEQYKDIYFTPQISFAVNKLTVDDSASNLLKKQEGSFNEIFFDYGFVQDKRDRTFMPTSGYIASFGQGLPLYADSPSILNKIAVSKNTIRFQKILLEQSNFMVQPELDWVKMCD